MGMIK